MTAVILLMLINIALSSFFLGRPLETASKSLMMYENLDIILGDRLQFFTNLLILATTILRL